MTTARQPASSSAIAVQLLAAAEHLLDHATPQTEGYWPRATAILTRQALEATLHQFLAAHAPDCERASFTAKLLVLRVLHPDPNLAARIAYTWSALSQATHHQAYDLPPTEPTLRNWLTTVMELSAPAPEEPR